MGFSLGIAAKNVCAAAVACIGGGDVNTPAATLGDAGKAATAFATFSSPTTDHGIEISTPKNGPSAPSI